METKKPARHVWADEEMMRRLAAEGRIRLDYDWSVEEALARLGIYRLVVDREKADAEFERMVAEGRAFIRYDWSRCKNPYPPPPKEKGREWKVDP